VDEINENNLPDTSQYDQSFNVTLNLPFLKNFVGWATFKAVMDIIGGALACLGIITAAYGVPQIISGVRLLNAVDDLKRYMAANELQKIGDSLSNLHKHFKLSGISIIVKICFTILFIIIYGVFIVYMLRTMPDILNNMPRGPYY
jgi:hypothetical protein